MAAHELSCFMILLPRGPVPCIRNPRLVSAPKGRLEPDPNIPGGLFLQERRIALTYKLSSDHRKYHAFLFAPVVVLEKSKGENLLFKILNGGETTDQLGLILVSGKTN